MQAPPLTETERENTAKLLLEFRKRGTFNDYNALCSVINMHLKRNDLQGYYTPRDIEPKREKSKYHLLFNLSNAGTFINLYQ